MAVQSDTSRISYAGNNSTSTSYAVPFVFLENAHLKAIAKTSAGVESVVTLTNHTGAGNVNGGTVRTSVAIPATSTLTIYRDVPITQTTTYAEGGDFPAASHERALDKLTQITQQLDRGLDRAVRFSEATPTNELPAAPSGTQIITSTNGTLGWTQERQLPPYPATSGTQALVTSGGGQAASWQTIPSIATGPITATGSTTPRFIADRFAEKVNVKDFGAVGDGAADDAPSIRAAIAYAVANNKATYFPSGNYRFATTTDGRTAITSAPLAGLGVNIVNNSTASSKQVVLLGDDAQITSTIHVSWGGAGIANYKWMMITGNFSTVIVRGIHFFDASLRQDQVANKGVNYAIQLLGISGNELLYHPREVDISFCTFTNFCQGVNIYQATNANISNNKFLYQYGQAHAGSGSEWSVGVGTRDVSNFTFCNNEFDGCTEGTLAPLDPSFTDRRCPDGIILLNGQGNWPLSDSGRSVVIANNSLKHFAREGILVSGKPNPSENFAEDGVVISGNALDGRYPTGSDRIHNWGIVVTRNNTQVTGNAVYQCTTGIKVTQEFQGGHNTNVTGNHIVMCPSTSLACGAPEDGSYGTTGIEVLSKRVLVSSNKIVAYDLPTGTLAGWNGGYANQPVGARIPTAIQFNGSATDCYACNNDIVIVSKSSLSVLCAAFQGDLGALRIKTRNNKISGCDFLFWSVGASTSFYSDGDIFENGQRLMGSSTVLLVSAYNNSATSFAPAQTGWYKVFLTGRLTGAGYLSIGSDAELSGTINQDSAVQQSELHIATNDDPDGAGGQVDTICTINQLSHCSFVPQGPIVTKVALQRDYRYGADVLLLYVNRVVTVGGNPMPLLIGWKALRGTKMSISHIERLASQPTPTFCVLTLRNGSQNITRVDTGGVVLPATGYGNPITGIAAPATTPEFIGQQFVRTDTGVVYVATGTSSSADWQILN